MTEPVDRKAGTTIEWEELIALGTRRVCPEGEVLAHEGQSTDSVFFVLAGELEVVLDRDGHETVVARCPAGEFVGQVAALAGTVRSATVRAVGGAEVVEIEQEAFIDWLSGHPAEAERVADEARRHLHNVQVAEIAVEVLGAAATALVPQLVQVVEWVDLAAGSTLFSEGDEADAAYFVLSGRLRTTRQSDDGERVLGEVGRGEVVGESAVLLRAPRSATVRAVRDTTLARLEIEAFESLLTAHPELMLMVVRRMVGRLSGNRATDSTAHSVALVITAPSSTSSDDWIIEPITDEIGRHGSTAFLSSDRIDAVLERAGIAQTATTDIRGARLNQHLAELEATFDHLLFLTDREPSEWSRRAIQRADRIVVITSARPGREERTRIDSFVELCSRTRAPKWLVMIDPPTASLPTPARLSTVRDQFDEVFHVRGGDSDLRRIARLSIGRGYGLVLGGGGARGFAHLGVLRALTESGVPVDRIGGASMGSIFAAMAAIHQDPDELVAACAKQFDRLLDYTVPIVALLKAKRITANLHEVFGGLDAEDLWLPFYCVSTNLTRSRLEVHRRGDLVTAIRASIAIPGVLPPVPVGNDLLVDGGVLNNLPADVIRADLSVGTVIAVDVAPKVGPGTSMDYGMYLSGWQALRRFAGRDRTPYPGLPSVLVRTMITGSEGKRATLRIEGVVDLYLDLEMKGVGLLEFDKFDAVVKMGYKASRSRIVEWAAAVQHRLV